MWTFESRKTISHLKREKLVQLREDKLEEDKEEYYIVDGDISYWAPA